MARLIGRDPRRVDQLRKKCGGRYDHKLNENDVRIYAPGIVAAFAQIKTDESKRLKAAQADIAEEKLRRMRGEVVSIAEVQQHFAAVGGAARQGIERLCRECQDLMHDALLEVRELKGPEPSLNGHSHSETNGTAAKPTGKPGRQLPATAPADKSRVRGKVREAPPDKPVRKRAV